MGSHSVRSVGLIVVACLFSCSDPGGVNSPAPCAICNDAGSTPATAQALEAGAEAGRAVETNLDNVPYPNPATGYGRSARAGTTAGSVMQNFKFLGYPNADRSQGLKTIALADYYDPCNKRHKLLHLSVAGVWCGPCNMETEAVVGAGHQLDLRGVAVLQALDDGKAQGQPATVGDLDYWVALHHSNFSEVLDPALHNLGGFFDAAAIPWNCDIDLRTMEIIDASVGWSGNVLTDVDTALQALPTTPSYPLPVKCN